MAGDMTIIVKNNSGSTQWIYDLGISIANTAQRTISDEFTQSEISKSNDLKSLVLAGTLVLNNGTSDIPIPEAAEIFNTINEYEQANTFATSGDLESTLRFGNSAGSFDIDMNSNNITNLADAANSSDAAAWGQVYTLVETATGAISTPNLETVLAQGNSAGSYDIDMNSNNIVNVADADSNDDAANWGQIKALTETTSGSIDLQIVTDNGNTTTNAITIGGSSTFQNDLTVQGDLYVQGTEYITNTEIISGDQIIAGKLEINGDSYLGNESTDTTFVSGDIYIGGDAIVSGGGSFGSDLDMNSNQINEVADATLNSDAPNWGQVQTLVASSSGAETLEQILAKGNSAGSYDIDMNNNQINNLADATLDSDAINYGQVKTYVETVTGGIDLQAVTDNGDTTTNGINVQGASTFTGGTTFNTSSQTYAPVIITPQTAVPSTAETSGSLMVYENKTYMYDPVRAKWLSMEKLPFAFGIGRAAQGNIYLDMAGGVVSSQTGYRMPYAGTILGIAFDSRSNTDSDIEIRKNNVASAIATLSTTNNSDDDFNLNIDFSAGDRLQCYLTLNGVQRVNYPEVWVYVAFRA